MSLSPECNSEPDSAARMNYIVTGNIKPTITILKRSVGMFSISVRVY